MQKTFVSYLVATILVIAITVMVSLFTRGMENSSQIVLIAGVVIITTMSLAPCANVVGAAFALATILTSVTALVSACVGVTQGMLMAGTTVIFVLAAAGEEITFIDTTNKAAVANCKKVILYTIIFIFINAIALCAILFT